MAATSLISPSRIAVIAGQTFRQLVMMKVFYFLIVFALLLLGLQLVDMRELGVVSEVDQNLRMIRGSGFFAMNVFSVILALSATALLLPKDVEERTLYTILCKPVSRLDYLIGKLLGVLALVGVSLLVMDALFCLMLNVSVENVVAEQSGRLQSMGRSQEVIDAKVQAIRDQGVTWNLQVGVLAVFLKAVVVASVALLVSTFSTSTIFTIVITVVVILIGLIQGDARDYFLQQQSLGQSSSGLELTRWIALFFPDFKLLGIEDGVVNGLKIPRRLVGKVVLVALLYSATYTSLSWFIFRRKEV